mmetsp:Transcript_9209/g.20090  ORF Transcript_9209/g.20090 Transcript_9209/m.20090 type:complete len:205 (+) Transcript_9209:285-899(+)
MVPLKVPPSTCRFSWAIFTCQNSSSAGGAGGAPFFPLPLNFPLPLSPLAPLPGTQTLPLSPLSLPPFAQEASAEAALPTPLGGPFVCPFETAKAAGPLPLAPPPPASSPALIAEGVRTMGFTTTGRCPAGGPDPDRAAWADQVTGVALTVAGRMIGALRNCFCTGAWSLPPLALPPPPQPILRTGDLAGSTSSRGSRTGPPPFR